MDGTVLEQKISNFDMNMGASHICLQGCNFDFKNIGALIEVLILF